MIKLWTKPVICLALATALAVFCFGQQSSPAGNSDSTGQTSDSSGQPSAQQQSSDKQTTAPSAGSKSDKDKAPSIQETGEGKVAGTSNDRLFYALPNFLTLQGRKRLPPLSTKDKFKVVALGTFDYFEFPWWGALSAISQAEDSEPAYGQGWAAYGKRYGTQAADSTVENFMVGAVFPSLLHQDPRFYQSGEGGFSRRMGYAVSRIFVTRGDSGRAQFNYSEIFGASTAAAISTFSYHPKSTYLRTPTNPHLFVASDRTIGNAASVLATQVTLDTITIVVKEFWPDIHRKMSRKPKPASVSQ